MDRPSMLEGMDAYRNSSDLELAELASLAEALKSNPQARVLLDRAQRLDATIRTAMHDVPAPAGLADRILAKCRAAEAASAEQQLVALAASSEQPAGVSRRRWLYAAAVAASALIAVGVWTLSQPAPEDPLAADNLVERASDWRQGIEPNAAWIALAQNRPGRPFHPIHGRVLAPALSWLDVSNLVGQPAVAYQLSLPGGPQAMLFVVDAKVAGLDFKPPREPKSGTMGQSIAFWQTNDAIYVLVIDDERWYRQTVDTSEPLVG